MVDARQETFARGLAHDLIAIGAPDELPLFESIATAFFRSGRAGRARSTDDLLGFGLDSVVDVFSPMALALATAVYQQALDTSGKAILEGSAWLVRRVGDRLRGHQAGKDGAADDAAPIRFTTEQLAVIEEVARTHTGALGLTEERSNLLVAAMLHTLGADE